MTTKDAEYRVSILLRLLGPQVSSSVLKNLPSSRRQRLQDRLGKMENAPPSNREVLNVLREFDLLLKFASNGDSSKNGSASPPSTRIDLSEDPFEAIGQVSETRLIAALRTEAAQTTAVVLSCLDESKAARILQQLPDELRDSTVLQLKEQFTPSLSLLTRLLQATLEKCDTFEDRELSAEKVDSDARVAKLLRTMEPERRAEVLEMLEGADPEASQRIRNALFSFSDLIFVEDRSMQRLLAEIDTATLSKALKSAEKPLTELVLNNLSKRARESLTEEIALLGNLSKTDVEESEATVVQAMIELDKLGELAMKSSSS